MYRLLFLLAFLMAGSAVFAQRKVRQATREGNALYHKEDYLNAEIQYRTALDGNAADSLAMYNLGNSLFRQQQDEKAQEALRHFVNAAQQAQKGGDRNLAAKAFYNAGDVCMAAQQYQQAIQMFKRALRNNPQDDEARYNLLLAQKLLSQQQNEDENKDDQQDQQDQQQQQDQQEQQQNQGQQDQDQNQDQQDQNQDQQPQDQQEQQQQQQPQQMSQEQAEAILNANNRDEQDTQDKVQQKQMQRRKTDKDW